MAVAINSSSGQKFAAGAALISVPFAALTQILFGLAHGGDIEVIMTGERALNLAPSLGAALYYAYWADVLGYYLIFLPVIVYTWNAFRPRSTFLVDLFSVCGAIFCVMGATGAVAQAEVYMNLRHVVEANPEQIGSAAALWETTTAAQWRGVWMLETLLGVVWFGGMSAILRSVGKQALAMFSQFIALVWLIQIATWLLPNAREMSDLALSLNALLTPFWAAWLSLWLFQAAKEKQPSL